MKGDTFSKHDKNEETKQGWISETKLLWDNYCVLLITNETKKEPSIYRNDEYVVDHYENEEKKKKKTSEITSMLIENQ